ncbi:hypothetical protein [Nocardia transvalensis]|uniref:hypothetical protein n=1 Tax=Nocardia transvalensis TaxID=37333 RepID=UPI001895B0FB|nr:hypothetical protein [Nocardia transvalensis]MBF6332365.1 hypothetical protein [Nocardia transvalensis]
MATAKLIHDNLGGYPGRARCYQLDPPTTFGGTGHEYVTIWVQPAFSHQHAEVGVIPATASGASALPHIQRHPGSFIPRHNPADKDDDYTDGCYAWALDQLGEYTITP